VVQAPTTPNPKAADEIKSAAQDARIRIDSVMNMPHWKYPLSSPGMRTSLYNAQLWGSEEVLLVEVGALAIKSIVSQRVAFARQAQEALNGRSDRARPASLGQGQQLLYLRWDHT
jgi:hypothetical protein